MTKGITILDGDGVLLDFNSAYAAAWHRAFGVLPQLRDENAYWPQGRWDVPRLEGEKLAHFRSVFDEQFWSTIPAIDGAIDACKQLTDADYELVCVTALASKFQNARFKNLQDLGFPIGKVIATTSESIAGVSPKAKVVEDLGAVVFVDDYLPYMQGFTSSTHLALITREPNGSPNVGAELGVVHSSHIDLAAFADFWLNRT